MSKFDKDKSKKQNGAKTVKTSANRVHGRTLSNRGSVVAADVARIAGVSTATVSRAINFPDQVSAPVRARIESVAKSLGWVPHGAARALASRRSGAIGAVFPTLTYGDFPRALQALQNALMEKNYTLLLAFSEYDLDQEFQQVRMLLERGVDGLVLIGKMHHPEMAALLERYNVPVIHAFVYDPNNPLACVGPDNRKALYDLTNYLIGLGHKRFGIIGQSTKNNDRVQARLQGVKDALAERSIAIHPKHQVEGRWGIREGKILVRQILKHSPQPTAIVCGNGYLAVGAILECQRLGLRIPDDISIAAYDDFELMSEISIPITTVQVSGEEVGRHCANILMEKLSGKESETQHEFLAEILVRESSGPPRNWKLPELKNAINDDLVWS